MTRNLIVIVVVLAALGSLIPIAAFSQAPAQGFVIVTDGRFTLNGEPYTFVGVNFWQGMHLGIDGPEGDRERLIAELDHLQELGVTNLRVMASSEGPDTEPYRMVPALITAPGEYNAAVLDGLDFLLAEMGQRDIRAVMVLSNYWHWSGGMAQYVSWHTSTNIPYPGDWGQFMAYSAQFYTCDECQTWYRSHIEKLITHTNPYTGLLYRDDPAIFAWELANEPRRYPDAWIDDTAAYIKSLDPNHMVTTGSEGSPPWENQDFIATHDGPAIDYATIHIWPQNWGWYNPERPSTYPAAEQAARDYLQAHIANATDLGKPLVLEEFGLARDWEPSHDLYDRLAPTTFRDRFYAAMFNDVFTSAAADGPAMGDNIWVWSGQAQPGDTWVGDPPHELPGWYSVYAEDTSTLALIAAHAEEMAALRN